ncbi:hypothetical protein AB1303_10355 [Saccharolobus solfataricus]
MWKYSTLIGIAIAAIFFISILPTNAISESQLGVQDVINTINTANWAGAIYGNHWSTDEGLFSGWNEITTVVEYAYLGNATFHYIPNPNGHDAVGIWVALEPYNPSESSDIGLYFLQAGFNVNMYPNGSYALVPFVTTSDNGCIVNYYKVIPISNIDMSGLYLFMCINYEGNNEVNVDLTAYYCNLQDIIMQYSNTFTWVFSSISSVPYSAYTIVEAPKNDSSGNLISMPQISGGKIYNFYFYYISSGQSYIGPGTPQPNTEFEAQVDNLDELSYYNYEYAYPYNGGQMQDGLWQFTYKFYDTTNDQTTYGL